MGSKSSKSGNPRRPSAGDIDPKASVGGSWTERMVTSLVVDKKLAPRKPIESDSCVESRDGECPICFLNYEALNLVVCCKHRVCTDCFLGLRNPSDTHCACPFCGKLGFSAIFEKDAVRATDTPSSGQKAGNNIEPKSSPPTYIPLSSKADRAAIEGEIRSQREYASNDEEYSQSSPRSMLRTSSPRSSSSSPRLQPLYPSNGRFASERRRSPSRSSGARTDARGITGADALAWLDADTAGVDADILRELSSYFGDGNHSGLEVDMSGIEEAMLQAAIRRSISESNATSSLSKGISPIACSNFAGNSTEAGAASSSTASGEKERASQSIAGDVNALESDGQDLNQGDTRTTVAGAATRESRTSASEVELFENLDLNDDEQLLLAIAMSLGDQNVPSTGPVEPPVCFDKQAKAPAHITLDADETPPPLLVPIEAPRTPSFQDVVTPIASLQSNARSTKLAISTPHGNARPRNASADFEALLGRGGNEPYSIDEKSASPLAPGSECPSTPVRGGAPPSSPSPSPRAALLLQKIEAALSTPPGVCSGTVPELFSPLAEQEEAEMEASASVGEGPNTQCGPRDECQLISEDESQVQCEGIVEVTPPPAIEAEQVDRRPFPPPLVLPDEEITTVLPPAVCSTDPDNGIVGVPNVAS